ncbi:TRAP transporter small permease [Gammaproteobacteria bacterium AS21]
MDLFLRVEKNITNIALIASMIMLTISVALGFYQVVTRFIFNAPSEWSEVASISLMVWSVFLASAPAFKTGMMMSVDVIYRYVPNNKALYLKAFIGICCLSIILLLIWLGCDLAYRVRFQMVAGLKISMSWVYSALPVGCMFSFFAILGNLVHALNERKKPSNLERVLL